MSNEVLVVASKVKAAIQAKGCNTGGDAVDGLNHWVNWLIDQAASRAQANGRKTVRGHDFMCTWAGVGRWSPSLKTGISGRQEGFLDLSLPPGAGFLSSVGGRPGR